MKKLKIFEAPYPKVRNFLKAPQKSQRTFNPPPKFIHRPPSLLHPLPRIKKDLYLSLLSNSELLTLVLIELHILSFKIIKLFPIENTEMLSDKSRSEDLFTMWVSAHIHHTHHIVSLSPRNTTPYFWLAKSKTQVPQIYPIGTPNIPQMIPQIYPKYTPNDTPYGVPQVIHWPFSIW